MEKFFGLTELLDYGLYCRGILITLYAIILFRASSTRLFGNHSTLDLVISIILGAILGEAIVNNIPLLPSMMVCFLIVCIHRLLAYLAYKSPQVGKYIKGEKVCIVKQGNYIKDKIQRCHITHHDILQALRLQHGLDNLHRVKEATLERGGQISFILEATDTYHTI